MTSSGKHSRRAPQTRSQQPQPTGHLARCQSVQTAFIYLQYNGRVGWLSHRMQTVVLRIRRTPPGDSWRAPGHPRVPRSQGRPGQGAFPSVLATPTGSFPRDRTGQVRMGRARRGAPDKRARCDLQRDDPAPCPHANPRQCATVHMGDRFPQCDLCLPKGRLSLTLSNLRGAVRLAPLPQGSPTASCRLPHDRDSPMGRGGQDVPKARIQTSETEVGGRPRRPP